MEIKVEIKKGIKGFRDTIEWYNNNAKEYAQSLQAFPSIRQINDFVGKIPKDSKVLDAGCAGGRDTILFSDRGIDVIGIDLSAELIKVARKKYPNIPFVEGDFLNLPFPNDSFGGVWSHASLVHFETEDDVTNTLKEFYRVLMPGGILHLFVKEQITDKKFEVVSDSLSKHDRFFQYFKKEEVNDYLEKVGFKPIEIVNGVEDSAGRKDTKWIVCLAKKD